MDILLFWEHRGKVDFQGAQTEIDVRVNLRERSASVPISK